MNVAGQNCEEVPQHLITPLVEREKKIRDKKAVRVFRYLPTILVFLYEPDKTYSSLIVQLEALIIEVPTVQVLTQ